MYQTDWNRFMKKQIEWRKSDIADISEYYTMDNLFFKTQNKPGYRDKNNY